MTYTPTNRPVPSDAPEDLYFNSSLLDQYVNGSALTVTDRNGVSRKTLAGVEIESATALTQLSAPDGAEKVSYGSRTVAEKLSDVPSLEDYGSSVVDGVTDNQDRWAAAAAANQGGSVWVPAKTYVSSANITGYHNVDWQGPGVLKRSSTLWPVTPGAGLTRILYASPSGDVSNDGLGAGQPVTLQGAVDILQKRGPVVGRQQIIGTAGVYSEQVVIPDALAHGSNYLEFKFPSAPGLRGDPSAWPVGGAVLSGVGKTGNGFSVGRYNKVYIEYLLVRDWYNPALSATQQTVSGITAGDFSFLYTNGVSYSGNGWNNLYVMPMAACVVTGGIADGARYGLNNTAGRLSLTANASTYTTVRNSLEYGLYAKHQSSTVLDFTEFLDCGLVAGAEAYGAAIFSYKSGTSVDTRSCTFKRNRNAYHLRSGGHIATEIPSTDVMGAGADANLGSVLTTGFSNFDSINYLSIAGRELSQNYGPATTSSTTTVSILDNICVIPLGIFQRDKQFIEIEIHGVANGGTANVRPTFTSATPTNFAFGTFAVASNTRFKIRLLIYPTGGTTQYVQFENVGATIGGALLGKTTGTAVFGSSNMTFKVRGEVTTGSLDIDRVHVKLWG